MLMDVKKIVKYCESATCLFNLLSWLLKTCITMDKVDFCENGDFCAENGENWLKCW